MKNPCTRECPDRFPGCDCERRKAWKFQQAQLKERRRRVKLADDTLGAWITRTKEHMRKTSPKRNRS